MRRNRAALTAGLPRPILSFMLGLGLLAGLNLLFFRPAAADTKVIPEGTAREEIFIWVPDATPVELPVLATADYQPEEALPAGISYPAGTVGQAFTFGIWQGETGSVRHFEPSIVLNVTYQDRDVEQAGVKEEKLMLMMYNPTLEAWVKLCSSTDIYLNIVSAALSTATSFEQAGSRLRGSSLLAVVADSSPPLVQSVDQTGKTTITAAGSDLSLQVLPSSLEMGTSFQVTVLPSILDSTSLRLLGRPADIKICHIDRADPAKNNRQLGQVIKPLKIGFRFDLATASRAGGQTNLTLVDLGQDPWLDLEQLGLPVVRTGNRASVDRYQAGTFGLAAR